MTDYLQQPWSYASNEDLEENIRNWALIFRCNSAVSSVVAKIKRESVRLVTIFSDFSQGLIAYDKYQGQSAETINNRIFHGKIPTDTTSRWINGEDVTRFSMKWNGSDYIEYGLGLDNPRQPKYFNCPRVLVREITNPGVFAAYTLEVAYNDPAVINILGSGDDCFALQSLEGILNSRLATFYHFNSSPKATKGAFPKILVDDIREFPLPKPSHFGLEISRIGKIADLLRTSISLDPLDPEITILESELNREVYKAYALEASEIETIDRYFSGDMNEPV